jgi:hypothetical protein
VPKSLGASGRTTAVVVNRDGDLEVHSVQDAPKQVMWSSRGPLTIGNWTTYRLIAPNAPTEDAEEDVSASLLPSLSRLGNGKLGGQPENVYAGRQTDSALSSVQAGPSRVQQIVDLDISVVMRKRAQQGYGIGNVSFGVCLGYTSLSKSFEQPDLNSSICREEGGDDAALPEIWSWIDRQYHLLFTCVGST